MDYTDTKEILDKLDPHHVVIWLQDNGYNIQTEEKYQEMHDVAVEFYKVLQEANGADSEKKRRLHDKLDELYAPFSENIAYYAFLEAKRIAAGMEREEAK